MPANNSTARPMNRDQKKNVAKTKDIMQLKRKLATQLKKGDITKGAYDRAMKKLSPAFDKVIRKGVVSAKANELDRQVTKKTMSTSSSRRTGRKIK